jgi:hypothetical protein
MFAYFFSRHERRSTPWKRTVFLFGTQGREQELPTFRGLLQEARFVVVHWQ